MGRDVEILAAFECLASSTQESIQLLPIYIHPNPAETIFYITTETGMQGHIIIEAYDQIGQKVLHQSIHSDGLNQLPVDVSGWMNGIYIINLRNEHGIIACDKIIVHY